MSALRRLWTALTQGVVATSATAADPRLRGRTYAIPFDRVWTEALALTDGGLKRWRLLHADDREGIIVADATAALLRSTTGVTISIALDENAQTRVDAKAASRSGRGDFGAGVRHLARFFRALDSAVAASPRRTAPRAG
ncbi:MAG TPA: DUF1499 domain-containing protein [Longimicrobiales bacterium]